MIRVQVVTDELIDLGAGTVMENCCSATGLPESSVSDSRHSTSRPMPTILSVYVEV